MPKSDIGHGSCPGHAKANTRLTTAYQAHVFVEILDRIVNAAAARLRQGLSSSAPLHYRPIDLYFVHATTVLSLTKTCLDYLHVGDNVASLIVFSEV